MPNPVRVAVGTCLFLLVLVVAGCGLVRVPGSGPAGGGAVVVEVVDGDTLVVRVGGRDEDVRLLGIDTPETKHPTEPVECFGKEASRHLTGLLPPGARVRLERDVEARDRFGRLLAYVYRVDDGLFVNLDLAAGGFAAALTIPPNGAHNQELLAAIADARAAGAGLWARVRRARHPSGAGSFTAVRAFPGRRAGPT